MSEAAEQGPIAPGPEHERLAPFVGTFATVVRLWHGPGDPFESSGTMVNRWVHGRRFLRQEFKGDAVEGAPTVFEGSGYFGYNRSDRRYEGVWVDNASTQMQFEHGDVDAAGRVWEMRGSFTDPNSGATIDKRTVITVHDDDRHDMVVYFKLPEGEFKAMELLYRRA